MELNETLQGALQTLATELGVKANELYSWFTGVGLESYVRVQVIQYGLTTLFSIIGFIVSLKLVINYRKICTTDSYTKGYTDVGDDVVYILSWIILIISLIVFVVFSVGFISWLFAPEGMIIEMFMTKLGG